MATDDTTPAENGQPVSAQPRRDKTIWITIAVIGALAIVAGGVFGYQIAARRLAGAEKLDRARQLIERADTAVVAVDKVVVAEVTPDSAKRAQDLTPTIPPAEERLREALDLLAEARPSGTEYEQKRNDLLAEAARNRLEMLKQAPTIMEITVKAAAAKAPAEQGWKRANTAEQLQDQSVAAFNKLSKAGAQQSATLDAQAEAEFRAARDLMGQAETAFPAADFEPYLSYLDAKIAQTALSRQATSVYLKGDAKKANDLAARFNAEDKRLVEVARALPTSPAAVVAQAYERTAEAATNAYFSAREKATKADDRLRRF